MEIQIPSPSVFLQKSPVQSPGVPESKKRPLGPQEDAGLSNKVNDTTSNKSARKPGVSKPRQIKNRNGCVTCKKDKLKCDESKPKCGQCRNRGVDCEGYKKEFKWKSFEDTIKQSRAGRPRKAANGAAASGAHSLEHIQAATTRPAVPVPNNEGQSSPMQRQASSSMVDIPTSPPRASRTTMRRRSSLSQFGSLPSDRHDSGFHSPSTTSVGRLSELARIGSNRSRPHTVSPDIADAYLRGDNMGQSSTLPGSRPHRQSSLSDTNLDLSGFDFIIDGDFVPEDIPDELALPDVSQLQWNYRATSPANSDISASSSKATGMSILGAPSLDPFSPEMDRFEIQTCGILSIKDGLSENPWRTFLLPLARHSEPLYHAVSAMSAFHGAMSQPELKLTGMAHLTRSIRKLSADMHKMSLDQTLATALALALSEAWSHGTSTGIQHLKGARSLLSTVVAQRSADLQFDQSDRENGRGLRFLTRTYIYLDAMACLTSIEESRSVDFEDLLNLTEEPFDDVWPMDPRMGCAVTLFPLLSKVGSLVQRIRETTKNGLGMISEANDLREQLLEWEPPDLDMFEPPDDVSSNVRHALQTAEAYRRAILLHLHQAVTVISAETSQEQARAILTSLAATPLSSRTMVVQTFPLLVGSCEVTEIDDREWVAQRWQAMLKRMPLPNVASCWKIVQETWRRRDHWESQRLARTLSPNTPGSHLVLQMQKPAPRRQQVRLPRRHTDVSLLSGELEYTVRGHLHWLGVMSDWNWEVFVG